MTRIIADISVSLDGFVTGPGPSPDKGLGAGGEALHTWAFPTTPTTAGSCARQPPARAPSSLAAGFFDVIDGPKGWNDETGYGTGKVGKPSFVVVTSSPPKSVRLTGLNWTFVTTGLPTPSPPRASARRRRRRTAARTSMLSSWAAAPRSARRSTAGWSTR